MGEHSTWITWPWRNAVQMVRTMRRAQQGQGARPTTMVHSQPSGNRDHDLEAGCSFSFVCVFVFDSLVWEQAKLSKISIPFVLLLWIDHDSFRHAPCMTPQQTPKIVGSDGMVLAPLNRDTHIFFLFDLLC